MEAWERKDDEALTETTEHKVAKRSCKKMRCKATDNRKTRSVLIHSCSGYGKLCQYRSIACLGLCIAPLTRGLAVVRLCDCAIVRWG